MKSRTAPETARADHIYARDCNGRRYTTHTFAGTDDPWRGALILTPSVVADLKRRGLLPLTPIVSEVTDDR